MQAHDDEALQCCWDLVIERLEAELLDRWGLIDRTARCQYEGRAGPTHARWVQVKWQPPHKRLRPTPELLAWTRSSAGPSICSEPVPILPSWRPW